MNLYSLPQDMREEVLKLASEHTVTIEQAYKYYLMGGYEHGEYLCSLADIGVPDCLIEIVNRDIWDIKNKELWKKLSEA